MADYKMPHIGIQDVKPTLDLHAGTDAQTMRLFKDRGKEQSQDFMSTMLPIESQPNLPPTMKNHNRWTYLEEFVSYWKYEHVARIIGITLLLTGFLTLNVFTPGALVMIAVAARQIDLAWWYGEIARRYGHHRSLLLVD